MKMKNYGKSRRYREYKEVSYKYCLNYVSQGGSLSDIIDPYPTIQKIAVELNGYVIRDIKNPTEEMKYIAIKQDASNIRYIENITPKMISLVLRQDLNNARYIPDLKYVPIKLLLYLLKHNIINLNDTYNEIDHRHYKKNITSEFLINAIKQDSRIIDFIKAPTEEMLSEAIKQTGLTRIDLIDKLKKVQIHSIYLYIFLSIIIGIIIFYILHNDSFHFINFFEF